MPNELRDFGHRLEQVTSDAALKRIAAKGGMAGKNAALEAAADDLGGDRAFSGMRRRASLGAGYDDIGGGQVRINFRPAGLWNLANDGRRGGGPIRPRRGSGKRAVMTPQGPRARSSFGPSRGLDTFRDAVRKAERDVPKAAFEQFTDEVRKVVR